MTGTWSAGGATCERAEGDRRGTCLTMIQRAGAGSRSVADELSGDSLQALRGPSGSHRSEGRELLPAGSPVDSGASAVDNFQSRLKMVLFDYPSAAIALLRVSRETAAPRPSRF